MAAVSVDCFIKGLDVFLRRTKFKAILTFENIHSRMLNQVFIFLFSCSNILLNLTISKEQVGIIPTLEETKQAVRECNAMTGTQPIQVWGK